MKRKLCIVSLLCLASLIVSSFESEGQNIEFLMIDFPDASSTFAQAINDNGQMVGFYRGFSEIDYDHGFLLDGGQFSTIDFPDAIGTNILAINNNGQMVEFYRDVSRTKHGFIASIETITAVSPRSKLTTTWGAIKHGR